jgi:hypothetical protein
MANGNNETNGNSGTNSMLGVMIGALIVIVVGGGLLYATGMVGGPKTTTVNVTAPVAPASAPAHRADVPDHRTDGRDNRPGSADDRRPDDHRPNGDNQNRR